MRPKPPASTLGQASSPRQRRTGPIAPGQQSTNGTKHQTPTFALRHDDSKQLPGVDYAGGHQAEQRSGMLGIVEDERGGLVNGDFARAWVVGSGE